MSEILYGIGNIGGGGPCTLLHALLFMWKHREGDEAMTFRVEDETTLMVKPVHLAKKYRKEISELKDGFLILVRGKMCEQVARALVQESLTHHCRILEGLTAEVHEWVSYERTDLADKRKELMEIENKAFQSGDWRTFNRALCEQTDLYHEMLEAYKAANTKAA